MVRLATSEFTEISVLAFQLSSFQVVYWLSKSKLLQNYVYSLFKQLNLKIQINCPFFLGGGWVGGWGGGGVGGVGGGGGGGGGGWGGGGGGGGGWGGVGVLFQGIQFAISLSLSFVWISTFVMTGHPGLGWATQPPALGGPYGDQGFWFF